MKLIAKQMILFLKRILGIETIIKLERENLYAHRFNSTIIGSEWFVYKNISPGNMAVDYGFFYTLYRILSSVKPGNILEFGLGQSSKMVHQYSKYYKKTALTVEDDEDWVRFFLGCKEGDYTVNIKMMELEPIKVNGVDSYTYHNCQEEFKNQKFDFIIVDGPHSHDNSRTQIIEMAKNNLKDNFIIMIDDYNTKGVQNTVEEIFKIFAETGIKYVYKVYMASKNHIVITTPQYRFLTTL